MNRGRADRNRQRILASIEMTVYRVRERFGERRRHHRFRFKPGRQVASSSAFSAILPVRRNARYAHRQEGSSDRFRFGRVPDQWSANRKQSGRPGEICPDKFGLASLNFRFARHPATGKRSALSTAPGLPQRREPALRVSTKALRALNVTGSSRMSCSSPGATVTVTSSPCLRSTSA